MAKVIRGFRKGVEVRNPKTRARLAHFTYGVFRFFIYGLMGCALEIVFYNLVRNLKDVLLLGLLFQFDWRVDERLNLNAVWSVPAISLFGQCSLWMFLVYAVASFAIEAFYRNFADTHFAFRSLVYGFIIFLWECASGWILFFATGYKIWFYADPQNFFEMTSWRILPIWCITGLIVEYLYRQLMDPDLVKAIETAHLKPEV